MRRLARNVVVTFLSAYALVSLFAAASAFWQPRGTVGLSSDYGAVVRFVSPGGPAALAGVVAGDRIELQTIPSLERRFVSGVGTSMKVGEVVRFGLAHDGSTRAVSLTAVADEMSSSERSSLLLQCFAAAIFIVVGASLVLLRPGRATWGFGLYCLLLLPTNTATFRLSSPATPIALILLYDVVQNIGIAGLLVFALEFPRTYDTPWRTTIRRCIPAIFFVLALLTLYPDVANLLLGIGAEFENRILQLAAGSVFGLALFILCDTYRRIGLDERERLRWALIGFGVGMVTSYIGNTLLFSSLIPIDPPDWAINALASLNVLLPVTVAYAVVRHRVLDINFVIGRALIYAMLTTVLAALFGLLDWGFGHVLEDFRLSRLVEAGVSIAIAFAFDTFHKRAESAIESIFFRKRYAAEARLDRLARQLPQARAVEVVEKALIGEVIGALELTSAALYRHTDRGFARTASHGWRDADCALLDDADLLLLSLRSEKRSLKLAEIPWHRANIPGGNVAPVVAVPLDSRGELSGLVLYGGHASGADIDPGELSLIERLARAASVALDELEAERLRGVNEQKDATIEVLNARLDELRRLVHQPSIDAGAADGGVTRAW